MMLFNIFGVIALIGATSALPFHSPYHGVPSALMVSNSVGNRYGTGYIGNPGIGIKQTDANLADLYGVPRQLAQSPPPRPINAVDSVTPYSPLTAFNLAPAPNQQFSPPAFNGFYQHAAANALNFGHFL